MLELLGSGITLDEILEDYKDLEREDLRAVLVYATQVTRVNRAIPVA